MVDRPLSAQITPRITGPWGLSDMLTRTVSIAPSIGHGGRGERPGAATRDPILQP